jgi:hypothetical protein
MLSIFLILVTIQLYGQKVSTNQELLEFYNKQRIDSLLEAQSAREHINSYNIEIANLEYFIIPTVQIKNSNQYDFKKKIINHIELNALDTIYQILILEDSIVVGQGQKLYSNSEDYAFYSPIFNMMSNFSILKNSGLLGNSLVFNLPFSTEILWVLKNNNMYALCNGKLLDADRFIRKNFNQREFIGYIDP